jgi:hypothetical protein
LLSAVAMKKMAEYSTSLEQDVQLIENTERLPPTGVTPQRYLAALVVRAGEKEILKDLLRLCQEHIAARTAEIVSNNKKRKFEHQDTTGKKSQRLNGKH